MKKIWVLLSLLALGCSKDQVAPQKKGSLTFSMSQVNRVLSGGRMSATATPAFALLSIEDNNGKVVVQNKKLSLFSFGQGWESESIELLEGNYKLTQFQILNANDTVIYASPLAGSELAKYVANPLPINFTISKNQSTTVVPQVLEVSSKDTPENFGYASFGFEIVKMPTLRIPLPNKLIDKVTIVLNQGQQTDTIEVQSPNTELVFNNESLLGKKWNTTVIVWYYQDSCFQRISRYKGEVDLTNNASVSLPHVTDVAWQSSFYSEHIYGSKKISIYRSISKADIKIEIDFPASLTPYYAYADQGYFDSNWVQVCGMPYVEIANNLMPPPSSPTYVQWKFNCSSDSLGILDDLIGFDLPNYGYHTDYFVWSADGRPRCFDNAGGIVNSDMK